MAPAEARATVAVRPTARRAGRSTPWAAAAPDGPPADRSGEAPRPSPGALPAPDARRRAGRSKPRGSSLPASRPVGPVFKNNVITLPELLLDLIGPSKILSLSSFFPFVYLPL